VLNSILSILGLGATKRRARRGYHRARSAFAAYRSRGAYYRSRARSYYGRARGFASRHWRRRYQAPANRRRYWRW